MNPSSPSVFEAAPDSLVRVEIRGATKTFPIDRRGRTMFQLVRRVLSGGGRLQRFVALQQIDLTVRRGDRIGLIGNNGAGKTSLLKLIAGLYSPDAGRVSVRGTCTLVSGLGIGMIDDLSVDENIALYGAIYGVDRDRVRRERDDILEWAELSEFAGEKLKRLSSGMRTRLAFSTMRHVDVEVYLLDEALTAGDRHFQAKCERVFDEYRAGGRTFVVATHDHDFVTRFCTHALWLHKSRVMAFGDPREVVDRYLAAPPN